MIIHLDTSVVIDTFSGPFRSRLALRSVIVAEHRIAVSTLVLYEWLRGPRLETEMADQEAALPATAAVEFDHACARTAARLYGLVKRARGREIDIAIAACAIEHGAALWTLNEGDFHDIPGLILYRTS
ncbi:MAG TPA: type II toxin-antitoxin system VapC family toxin [Vicinamibacterales bacterium]